MIGYPPSPAFSACDSLADIDDLDAFLEAQGQLSHWPTPPSKKDVVVTETELDPEDGDLELDCKSPPVLHLRPYLTNTDCHLAHVFTQEASIQVQSNQLDLELVQRILVRAQLPQDVVALAFNIICELDYHSLPFDSFYSATSDLLVVSALSLASSYTNDHPPSFSHWSRYVCDGTWTARRIDKTTLLILAALDWHLHELYGPSALERASARLVKQAWTDTVRLPVSEMSAELSGPIVQTPKQLRLFIEATSACWVNGQLTPEGTPPCSAYEETENCYLPLL